MEIETTDPSQLFKLGSLYFDRGEYKAVEEYLSKASEFFLKEANYNGYLESQNIRLRIYGEQGNEAAVLAIKEKLQDLALSDGFEMNSHTYYTLGVCASYRRQDEKSLEYFQKALEFSLKNQDKKDMCQAILGIATCYKNQGLYSDALNEIYNLKIIFDVLDAPLLKAMTKFLNANLLLAMKKYEEAIEIYWECYDQLKEQKNIGYLAKVLYRMGLAYTELGNTNLAETYLKLALRSIDKENMALMYKDISDALSKIGVYGEKEFDLVLNASSHVVTEKRKGKVDFKNQFILLDLLHLLIKNPGETFSKEELVNKVWKQDYNPSVHDNKIYVTIKRLRKMVEPDYDKPRYIFRGKNGYYLNKTSRVLLEN